MEVRIRGKTYNINLVKDSSVRRAVQYYNNTFASLRKIGLTSDHVDVSEERNPLKKAPAYATWYIEGHRCHFSYNKMPKFVDNIQIVSKVVDISVKELLEEKMTFEEFVESFREDHGFEEKRKEAREFFGLEEDHTDLTTINEKYKKLAKELHPDMPTGDEVKFKKLNEHHKTLKRELE